MHQTTGPTRRLEQLLCFATQKTIVHRQNEFQLGCAVGTEDQIVVLGKVIDALIDNFQEFASVVVSWAKRGPMIYCSLSPPNPPKTMIVLDVKFIVKDGCHDEAVAAMKEVAAETLKEAGCAEYRFAIPFAKGDPIVLFEEWESQDALNAHFETSHLAAFREKMKQLLAEPATIRRYVVSEAGPL